VLAPQAGRPARPPRSADHGEVSEHAPTYTETWPLLSPGDRRRLAELDDLETDILRQLAGAFADEVDAPTLGELQVERLRVYRDAQARARRQRSRSDR